MLRTIAMLSAGKIRVNPACFTVHGRLSNWNGNPTQRIWVIGTKRMLGLRVDTSLPKVLEGKLGDFDDEVYGDFEFCLFTPERPGVMQVGCLAGVSHYQIEKRGDDGILPPLHDSFLLAHLDRWLTPTANSNCALRARGRGARANGQQWVAFARKMFRADVKPFRRKQTSRHSRHREKGIERRYRKQRIVEQAARPRHRELVCLRASCALCCSVPPWRTIFPCMG